jgi:hypothetical protein
MGILTATWNAVVGVLTAAWDGVMAVFRSVWDGIKIIWQTLMDLFQGKIGLMEAVGKIFGAVFDTAKVALSAVAEVFKKYFEGLGKIFSSGAEAFSKVFTALKDGAGEIGGKIVESLKKGLEGAGKVFAGLGTKIWDSLKTGLDGIGDILKDAIKSIDPSNILAKVFKPDSTGPGKVESILGINIPYVAFAQGGMVPGSAPVFGDSPINDRVLALLSPGEAVVPRSVMQDPRLSAMVRSIIDGKLDQLPSFYPGQQAVEGVKKQAGGGLSDPAAALGGTLGDLAKQGKSGFEGLGNLSTDAYNSLNSFLEGLDPTQLWQQVLGKVGESVMNMLRGNSFHNGGLVGYANGGEVPAMLQSGEFVMNRQAVQSLGLGSLNQMNRGAGAPANQTFNFNIEVEVRSDGMPDESFIRQRMIPAVKKELKDASLRGEFLMSSKGIRNP